MKIKVLGIALLAMFVCDEPFAVRGQGTFQNLGFESATVPTLPSGQFGGFVPIGAGFPHWNGYLGTNEITQVQHNNFYLGTASISILGPDWSFSRRIEGSYTALLQPGRGFQNANVDVTISQTSLIPLNALSFQFTSDSSSHQFAVSFGGQNLPVYLLSTSTYYSSFGIDVSSIAGLTKELRITALYNQLDNGFVYLDAMNFSDQAIPEPSTFCLFGVGALLLGWRLLCRNRD